MRWTSAFALILLGSLPAAGWESAWISVFPGVGADTVWCSEIAEAGAGSGCSYQFRVSRSEDGVGEDDLIVAGEGAEGFYLYLAEERVSGGARKLRVSGLDLLSDTPEGASLLDNLLDYLKEFGGHASREELRRCN